MFEIRIEYLELNQPKTVSLKIDGWPADFVVDGSGDIIASHAELLALAKDSLAPLRQVDWTKVHSAFAHSGPRPQGFRSLLAIRLLMALLNGRNEQALNALEMAGIAQVELWFQDAHAAGRRVFANRYRDPMLSNAAEMGQKSLAAAQDFFNRGILVRVHLTNGAGTTMLYARPPDVILPGTSDADGVAAAIAFNGG